MTSALDIERMLREVADLIHAEPDPEKRAALVGAFNQTTTRLRQELVSSTAYAVKMSGLRVSDIAALMKVSNGTISNAIHRRCKDRGLPLPKRFNPFTLDPETIVTLPPKEG